MRILYAAFKYDYGRRSQGYSHEHNNIFDALVNMGHDILYFDIGSVLKARGRERMNEYLLDVVTTESPDLMFTVLFRNELQQRVVRTISDECATVTFNWFCDDHWRFDNYSRYWAPCFNWVATTAQSALPKYGLLGYANVIKSQWACNHYQYQNQNLPPLYDATFVGLPHGDRPYVLQAIRDAGIDVRVWGLGWPTGRVSQSAMIRIFNQSKINLNLSNASRPPSFGVNLSGFLARRLLRLHLSEGMRSSAMRLLSAVSKRYPSKSGQRYAEQIKGRNFEVPGTGGFLLTGLAENLADYYEPGREVASFRDEKELVRRLRYYLIHENERASIAEAGFQRTLAENTYVHRFCGAFQRMGLPTEPAATVLARGSRPGKVVELSS